MLKKLQTGIALDKINNKEKNKTKIKGKSAGCSKATRP
jgi:hypothetical protein